MRHDAYENRTISDICQVLHRTDIINNNAVLDLFVSQTSRSNSIFCNSVYLTLEREENNEKFRKRFLLWYSRFATNGETVCSRLNSLGSITLKFSSKENTVYEWTIISVSIRNKFCLRGDQTNQV